MTCNLCGAEIMVSEDNGVSFPILCGCMTKLLLPKPDPTPVEETKDGMGSES